MTAAAWKQREERPGPGAPPGPPPSGLTSCSCGPREGGGSGYPSRLGALESAGPGAGLGRARSHVAAGRKVQASPRVPGCTASLSFRSAPQTHLPPRTTQRPSGGTLRTGSGQDVPFRWSLSHLPGGSLSPERAGPALPIGKQGLSSGPWLCLPGMDLLAPWPSGPLSLIFGSPTLTSDL